MKKKIYLSHIHTNKNHPGRVYAVIREYGSNELIVSATFSYCAQWISAAVSNNDYILCDESGKEI